jgi:hypothetical protein
MSDHLPMNVWINCEDYTIADLPTMYDMDADAYRSYVHNYLFNIDHHDYLRSLVGGHGIAISTEQLDILIEELKVFRTEMKPHA